MSIYGIAQFPIAPSSQFMAADIACPAGVETNVIGQFVGAAAVALGDANLALVLLISGYIVLGATPPTALVIAARNGAGADFDTYTIAPSALVASAQLSFACALFGLTTKGLFSAQQTINITVTPTGQAVTAKAGMRATYLTLFATDT